MPTTEARDRRQRGDWPTPFDLVARVVQATLPEVAPGVPISVLDPACGDGRFLAAAAARIESAGGVPILYGVDVDPGVLAEARRTLSRWGASLCRDDALTRDWGETRFDVVLGNPPYLSQLAAATARGGASRHGGGPYADAAVEFLALAVRLARPDGGRVGLVLPQSILGSRDAGPVRAAIDELASIVWSWWSPERVFEADVVVCALALERGRGRGPDDEPWTRVVTRALGVPAVPPLAVDGLFGARAELRANFRDEYYGLVPAVGDDVIGPPLVTSGLVDPGRCHWGERPVRFARRKHERPRVAVDRLAPRMRRWATSRLVPKVLIANQTRVVEAVADGGGDWIPGVPLISAFPRPGTSVDELAAVLTSPVATAWCWDRAAGTGLSARALRLSAALLAELPWPRGSLAPAVRSLAAGDVAGCGREVERAYGLDPFAHPLQSWWQAMLPAADTAGRR